jgi:hypothetical protein
MPFDPNRVPDEGDISPQTLVFNYLKSKGLPLNADNVRRTIEANARDPGVLGPNVVAGLRNTGTEDSNPRGSGGVGQGGGSAAGRIEGGAGSKRGGNTPVDATNTSRTAGERSATSAPPQSGEDDSFGFNLPGALGAAVLGGGLYGASRLFRGQPKPELGIPEEPGRGFSMVGEPYTPVNPDDVMNPPGSRPDPAMRRGGPGMGDPLALPAPAPQGLLESSMQKALAAPGPEGMPQLGGPSGVPQLSAPSGAIPLPDATSGAPIPMGAPAPAPAPAQPLALPAPEPALPGVQPYQPMAPGVQPVPPSAVSGMPVGPSTADPAVLNEANIRGNLVPPPQIPLRPRVPSSIIPPNIQELIRGGLQRAAPALRGLRMP